MIVNRFGSAVLIALGLIAVIADVTQAQSDGSNEPCLSAESETILDFSGSRLAAKSTLEDVDGEMRVESVGSSREGDAIKLLDMVVKRTPNTPYKYANTKNNKVNGYYGMINLDSNNGEGTFDFCFVESATGAPFTLDHFYFSFYDLDAANSVKGFEQITLKKKDFLEYFVTNSTEIQVFQETSTELTLEATEYGTAGDNPDDPNDLSQLQQNRGVVFLMKSMNCFQLKLSVRCEEGGCGGGRNFLFAGRANQLIPQCPTPSPTIGPSDVPTASTVPTDSPTVNSTGIPTDFPHSYTASPTSRPSVTPNAPRVEPTEPTNWDQSPVNTCDCLDLFTSQAGGNYVLSNKYFDLGEGVDTQERRIEISTKNLYTDAVAFSMNDDIFEIHGDNYYRNRHPVSLPITDFGQGMAEITKSFVSADTEEIMVDLGQSRKLVARVTSGTGPRKFIKLLERPV